ncbi:MAG: 4-hydroxy-tetrahydrodipicolinate synthase [Bacteroidales bacterium]|nr:4-hydroxy-tetrahydrodipicolinate synthase [Bacteroidales bacterium]
MLNNKFSGTAVATVTPFKKDKSIDFVAFEKLIEYYIENGIDYLVVLGTTGENATLSAEEKNQVIDFAIEKVNGRIPIVAGFGGYNTENVIKSIKSRDFKGIDGILSVSPYYNKPNQQGLFEHFTAIADASPVPVIIYNVPGRTGVNISAETTLKLAEHQNIAAIKEASGNMDQIMKILQHKPADFMVISGDDALTYPMIMLGSSGVISVVGMAEPKKMSDMVRFALAGKVEEAKKLHFQLLDITNAIFEDGNPGGIKAVLYLKNLIDYNLRLPLVPVNEKTYEKIKSLI